MRYPRIPVSGIALAAVIGCFALPFGTVMACEETMTVSGFQLVTGSPPHGKPVRGGTSDDDDRDVERVVVERGSGLALVALICAALGTGLSLVRGRRAAVAVGLLSAGGGLAVGELAWRGRREADAFDPRVGLWLMLGGFGLASLASAAAALRGGVRAFRRESLAAVLGVLGVAALFAGAVHPFVRVVSEDERTDLYSSVDFVAPASGRENVWLGLEAALLVLAAAIVLAVWRRWPRLAGGALVGLGAVSLSGHLALIVDLHREPADEAGYSYALGLGGIAWVTGAALLVAAGVLLSRTRTERDARPLPWLARIGALVGAGLAAAAVVVPFDSGGGEGKRQVAIDLHGLPAPLAYGAGPLLAAALAILVVFAGARAGSAGRGLLAGLAFETALLFLVPLYTLFVSDADGDPAAGLWIGLAAGGVLLASALAAAATKPQSTAFR
jgi:hypothetical protein